MSEAVTLEVYRHLFAAVAEEMGAVLQRTGCSPNIKERRDYSCAVFDAAGAPVAQGENIPVHLGSLPASVEAALAELSPGPGDVVLLNDPYRGGTHLPDITMVAPVHLPGAVVGDAPLFHVANRAHHSDIGGSSPGSMPLVRELIQEGLVLPPVHWRRAGRREDDVLRILLANVRTPDERRGDLAAQEAALEVGAVRLLELVRRNGADEVTRHAALLQDRAERSMRALIASIPDGDYRFEDRLDDDGQGAVDLAVRLMLRIRGEEAVLDFSGTAPAAQGGINAVPAIVRSAALYVFRCLLPPDVPTSAGLERPLSLEIPPGSLLDPPPGGAVAAGNVETSQRLVDTIFGALAGALPERVPAASQGTMNNLALGGTRPDGRRFAYYETLAGGHGGGPWGPGMSARHSHMTNSLNTPVEALENELPLRVERYAVRRGSGGAGRHPGGDGVLRAVRFLCAAEVTLLTERRRFPPWGLAGGSPGRPGKNTLIRASAAEEELPGKVALDVAPGDVLVIETPGGGGWGRS